MGDIIDDNVAQRIVIEDPTTLSPEEIADNLPERIVLVDGNGDPYP
jgi:hypothetical protein